MLLHIGADQAIPLNNIKFILNAKGIMPLAAAFLERAKAERRFTACAGRAKSFIITEKGGREHVHASPLAASTLERRLLSEIQHEYLSEQAVLTAFLRD